MLTHVLVSLQCFMSYNLEAPSITNYHDVGYRVCFKFKFLLRVDIHGEDPGTGIRGGCEVTPNLKPFLGCPYPPSQRPPNPPISIKRRHSDSHRKPGRSLSGGFDVRELLRSDTSADCSMPFLPVDGFDDRAK